MSDSTTIFSGTSRYSSDFQAVIDRSVSIASLPITQLNSQKSTLTDQSTALSSLDTKFTALQSAFESLQKGAGPSGYSAATDDSSVASARVSGTALAGSYEVEVVGLGSYSLAMSTDGLKKVSDPSTQSLTTSSSLTLTVDGTSYNIAPASNTLNDLAAAINNSGAGVHATMVNLGSNASPDYRLSVQGDKLAGTTIQLNDGTNNLLESLATGSAATYRVNGQPSTAISSDSRNVTLAPGLSLTLLSAGETSVTVARDTSSVANALSSFVTAYNAIVDELDTHRVQNTGALNGQSIVSTLSQSLQQMITYSSGSSGVTSLASLGITLDQTGKLAFDQTTFDSVASDNPDAVASFLGDSSTGGFLKQVSGTLDGIENSTSGVLEVALNSVKNEITDTDTRISDNQDRVNLMKDTLEAKMAAADALIASMEQQVSFMTGLFAAMKANQGA